MIPRHEIDYILESVCDIDSLLTTDRFDHLDRDSVGQILDTVERVCTDYFGSIAEEMDAYEVFMEDDTAKVHPAAEAGLAAARDAGLFSATFTFDDHGLQLPHCVAAAINSVMASQNVSLNAFIGLTSGSARLISSFGTDALKEAFLEPMVSGRYFGTMCLSETHAGSSLAEIRTRAEPTEDGTYLISGEKMWITAGDHEFGENIVHLVLARLPDAPAGVKGISLFVVPKFRIADDGSRGAQNDVKLIGLNHKMGQRGVPNAVLKFGDEGKCQGYLLGRPNYGMAQMFQMMNELRLYVGAVSAGLGYEGAVQSRAYANERKQGKSLDAEDAHAPQVEIIEHPDVRRMLLAQRALTEGAMSIAWYCASLLDRIEASDPSEDVSAMKRRLDLLTPLAKTWPAEQGTRANDIAVQVLGGAGYTRDFPVERLYRDNRINPIHEGTTGIQSLDLMRRKILGEEAQSLNELFVEIETDCAALPDTMSTEAEMLRQGVAVVRQTVETLLDAKRGQASASVLYGNATPFLEMVGAVVISWLWVRQAKTATDTLAEGKGHTDFLHTKLSSCRYFLKWELPKALSVAPHIAALDETWTALEREALIA